MLWQVRIHLYPLAKIMGYRSYEPDRDTLLVTCCTNGLGHVHQMERVLSVLEETGMKFPHLPGPGAEGAGVQIGIAEEAFSKRAICKPQLGDRL